MKDAIVTIASLRSVLVDRERNLQSVRQACARAERDGARLLLLPELMLTGHGGHRLMTENAEAVPNGKLAQQIIRLSQDHGLCISVGMAELDRGVVYNSQIVADRGRYLGLQRKINLSGDEYLWFGAGESLRVFDIGELRFGIIICYDNLFPEHALLLALGRVDILLCPHAARTGAWPTPFTDDFQLAKIREQQEHFRLVHCTRAYDHNVFVLVANAVGSSTEGLEGVEANHATHQKLFQRLLESGFHIGGIEVGESMGNPEGCGRYSAYYRHVVKRYGLDARSCLYANSRGGLMLYNWAADHPEWVHCIGANQPVIDLALFPGLDKAAEAYQMPPEKFREVYRQHNPMDRLQPLAARKIPILHIVGEIDKLLPLKDQMEMKSRYNALGGELEVLSHKGIPHGLWPELLEDMRIYDFFMLHAGLTRHGTVDKRN